MAEGLPSLTGTEHHGFEPWLALEQRDHRIDRSVGLGGDEHAATAAERVRDDRSHGVRLSGAGRTRHHGDGLPPHSAHHVPLAGRQRERGLHRCIVAGVQRMVGRSVGVDGVERGRFVVHDVSPCLQAAGARRDSALAVGEDPDADHDLQAVPTHQRLRLLGCGRQHPGRQTRGRAEADRVALQAGEPAEQGGRQLAWTVEGATSELHLLERPHHVAVGHQVGDLEVAEGLQRPSGEGGPANDTDRAGDEGLEDPRAPGRPVGVGDGGRAGHPQPTHPDGLLAANLLQRREALAERPLDPQGGVRHRWLSGKELTGEGLAHRGPVQWIARRRGAEQLEPVVQPAEPFQRHGVAAGLTRRRRCEVAQGEQSRHGGGTCVVLRDHRGERIPAVRPSAVWGG